MQDVGATIYRTDLQGNIICYSDGDNLTFETQKNAATTEQADEVEDEVEAEYIGNKNSKKLHYAYCSSVDDMKESNKVAFDSREDAISQGYEPCKRCNP